MGITEIGSLVGAACCCGAVFVVLLVAGLLALRPRRRSGADLDGVAAAPRRGARVRASLTRMEDAAPRIPRPEPRTLKQPQAVQPPAVPPPDSEKE